MNRPALGRAAVPSLLLGLALGLAACGSTSASPSGGSSASGPSSSSSPWGATPAVQPCDAVRIGPVAAVLGHGLRKSTGTADSPTCILRPTVKGDPVFQLNYQWWFKGGLEQAWKTMKNVTGTVTRVHVPGADDAKLVVQTTRKAAFVTGFVEDGNLIQVVNGEALPTDAATLPTEAKALRRATLLLMAQVSRGAPGPSASASS